jgi:hypothetical protein
MYFDGKGNPRAANSQNVLEGFVATSTREWSLVSKRYMCKT